MKNILFGLLLLLCSCTRTKLIVSNNAFHTGKVLKIERKGILPFGALPAIIFIDNEKVAKIGPKGKLYIPVKEGIHTVKIRLFPHSKKHTYIVNYADTAFLTFRIHPFGIKIIDVKK